MPGPASPDSPLERLGSGVFPNRDGQGLGPTLGPGLSAEHQRDLVEREAAEARSFARSGEAAGGGASARPAPGAAGPDLDSSLLSSPAVGEGGNEIEAELLDHARAQAGEAAAPDQTRAEGRLGGINDTEGL